MAGASNVPRSWWHESQPTRLTLGDCGATGYRVAAIGGTPHRSRQWLPAEQSPAKTEPARHSVELVERSGGSSNVRAPESPGRSTERAGELLRSFECPDRVRELGSTVRTGEHGSESILLHHDPRCSPVPHGSAIGRACSVVHTTVESRCPHVPHATYRTTSGNLAAERSVQGGASESDLSGRRACRSIPDECVTPSCLG